METSIPDDLDSQQRCLGYVAAICLPLTHVHTHDNLLACVLGPEGCSTLLHLGVGHSSRDLEGEGDDAENRVRTEFFHRIPEFFLLSPALKLNKSPGFQHPNPNTTRGQIGRYCIGRHIEGAV